MRGAFRECYQEGVSVSPSGNLPPVTTECVYVVAGLGKFAPPNGGSAVIQVPITFMPKESEDAPPPAKAKHRECGVREPRF